MWTDVWLIIFQETWFFDELLFWLGITNLIYVIKKSLIFILLIIHIYNTEWNPISFQTADIQTENIADTIHAAYLKNSTKYCGTIP